MTINNQTIHGGNQQFSNSPCIEQEVMDALREQAEKAARRFASSAHEGKDSGGKWQFVYEPKHSAPHKFVADEWRSFLTPKAAALYAKMEASQKKNQ